jgi:hypothetical protein
MYGKYTENVLKSYSICTRCIIAYKKEGKKEQKAAIINVVNHIPEANRRVLKILSRHLNKVCPPSPRLLLLPPSPYSF